MQIAGIEIGPGSPCRIVAEISNNHNGDRDRCGRLIDAAKTAGADLVKFQCYTPEELVVLRGDGPAPEPWGSRGWTMRTLYEKAQTPHDWFPKIKDHCERIKLPWFSSVFGVQSLALLESLDCPAYKIAALERKQARLVRRCLRTKKPVLISSPVDAWLAHFSWSDTDASGVNQAMMLYCPPGYPPDRIELPLFQSLDVDESGSWFCGLSSHCLAPELPIAAVARGAKILEYHLMLREEPSELEANVSLDQYQFAAMVDAVRRTEELLG